MEIEFAVSKTNRYDQPESCESTQIIERPAGGRSMVFCAASLDGVRSKIASTVVVNRIMARIADGSRDGEAIRGVSDQLFREYTGKLSGNLAVISADFETNTFVISRNLNEPVFYFQRGKIGEWNQETGPVCTEKGIRPSITEIPIELGTILVFLSPGAFAAGQSFESDLDYLELLQSFLDERIEMSAMEIADFILARAVMHDQKQPQNDFSVHIIKVTDREKTAVRRLQFCMPVPANAGEFSED